MGTTLLLILAAVTVATTNWTAPTSKFVNYSAEKPPLQGVRGLYVLHQPAQQDRLVKFLVNSKFITLPSSSNGESVTLPPISAVAGVAGVMVVSSFDQKTLSWSASLESLFGKNQFSFRSALVAGALSHFRVWRHIAEAALADDELHVVLDDTAALDPDFISLWNTRYQYALPSNTAVAYLGGILPENSKAQQQTLQQITPLFAHHTESALFAHNLLDSVDDAEVLAAGRTRQFHYSPVAYVLSGRAAKTLVQMATTHGMAQPVDWFLMHLADRFPQNVLVATPPLAAITERIVRDRLADPALVAGNPLPAHLQQPAAQTAAAARGVFAKAAAWSCPAGGCAQLEFTNFIIPGDTSTRTHTVVLNRADRQRRLRHFRLHAARAGVKSVPHVATNWENTPAEGLRDRGIVLPSFNVSRTRTLSRSLTHLTALEVGFFAPLMLVFEDDVVLPVDFLPRLGAILADLPADWDFVALGLPVLSADCAAELLPGPPLSDRVVALTTPATPACSCGLLTAYLASARGVQHMRGTLLPIASGPDRQLAAAFGADFKAFASTSPLVAQSDYFESDLAAPGEEEGYEPPPVTATGQGTVMRPGHDGVPFEPLGNAQNLAAPHTRDMGDL